MSSMPGAAVATTSITPLDGQPLGDATETVGVEVFGQGRRRGERETVDVSADQRGQRGLAVELDNEHTKSPIGCRASQNRGYRGLPDAPLASNDGNVGVGQELQRIHALRRHLCAD